ncbi:hypothetical protein LMH87_002786 [Akanthomyces muscarius]|uniref:Wax synthase domain-containing protein n=1 Tax=Akanthomyces muscarius TaxID=2231603 RepID=A0A9W8Q8D5_AKAMU|nr:hypothetical protein LMH87_002786 [Akanthomyces muscarius]KAJ4148309.1 hypothetical protein LMH87_002786 [Akanthomyces muscarius]
MAAPPLSPTAITPAILSIAIYALLFALTLVFLPRNAIVTRTLSLVPLTLAACSVFRYAIALVGPAATRQSSFLGLLIIHWLGLVEYILLSRVDSAKLCSLAAPAASGQTERNGQAGLARQLWQALSLSCNARRLGTEWEVKNVYHRAGGAQTRLRFVAHVVPRIVLCYLVVEGLTSGPLPEARFITAEKQTAWKLWTLTGEDVGFRVGATMFFWLITYCVIYILIHVPAVVSVVLGMSAPEFWPHLFGPMSALYTIRGFWGSFWHQRLRKTLTSLSDFIASAVLAIPHPSVLSTYTRLFLVFAISGLLHHPADIFQGMPVTQTASLAFFLMQPVGIVAEDAVQALTRSWPLPRVMRSIAGYAWVALFLVCTTPTWMFGVMRLGQTPDVLPKVVKPLVDMLTAK